MNGIDISNWQSDISVGLLDVEFCIVKATEGIGYVDPSCNAFVNSCVRCSVPYGFYHFARENDPLREAEFFVNACKGYFGHGIPVLDYETDNQNNRLWCEQFVTRVHDLTGVWCMLYISASRCSQYAGSWIAKKCPLWAAGYPYTMTSWPDGGCPYNCSPWKRCTIWQFTDVLRLSGYGGDLDGDVAYIDRAEWAKLADSKCTPVEPEKTEKTIDELAVEVLDGKYGNGIERKKALGAKYKEVQNRVDELYRVANQVLKGIWGNGWNRVNALEGAGYPADVVQRIVNEIYAERIGCDGC